MHVMGSDALNFTIYNPYVRDRLTAFVLLLLVDSILLARLLMYISSSSSNCLSLRFRISSSFSSRYAISVTFSICCGLSPF